MELPERHNSQSLFMKAQEAVAVATNAFGMGINKPDIRFVLHYNLPGSLEAYYQEAGRAGRDGGAAECRLLYLARDRRTQEFFIEKMGENNPQLDERTLETLREHATTKLWKMVDYASKPVCRRRQILDYFGDTTELHECKCDICETQRRSPKVAGTPAFLPRLIEEPSMMVQMHILHAVKEMEDRKALRGIGVVADVLRGIPGKTSQSGLRQPRVRHPHSPTNPGFQSFSALSGYRLDEIEGAVRYMIRAGILRQEDVGNGFPRPVLKLTEPGRELVSLHPVPPPTLSGDRKGEEWNGREGGLVPSKRPQTAPGVTATGGEHAGEHRQVKEASTVCPAGADFDECFQRLRVWRLGVAQERGMPAFCVFHDSVLMEIAARKPSTIEALRNIPGIGPKKLADYGSAVLATIAKG